MRIISLSDKNKPEEDAVAKEIVDWFNKRTARHISYVNEFCGKIAEEFPEFKELVERGKVHDASKYEEPERSAYLWVSWKYKCKDDGLNFKSYNPPDDVDEKMNAATKHHILNNSHHPEYHCGKKDGLINSKNRDQAPESGPIDATSMPDLDVAEMCADWCGMSKEKKSSPKDWAKKNIGKRWMFTEHQEDLIHKILDKVWIDM